MSENTVGTGKPGPGRPPGASNKITRDIKEAIVRAFENVGGSAYLERVAAENPQVFCALLGKVLPMQVTGANGGDLRIIVSTGVPRDGS